VAPAKFDPTIVPNPYAALVADAGGDPASQRSFLGQRQRRAAILATTRRLLADGQDTFTLRRVAEQSQITVQTLRNSFGRREDLMVSAINDHTSAVWAALGGFSTGPILFLDLAEMYFHCAKATPDFLRAMVTSAVANTQPLAVLQRHGSSIKTGHLRRMAREGLLRDSVDAEALAAQITRLNTFMMYEWATGGEAGELRRQLVSGNKLLLLGALTARPAALVEAWAPAEAA
jgi:AcrR family transcriptional regulator